MELYFSGTNCWRIILIFSLALFCNYYLVSSRYVLSLRRGIDGVVWRDQTTAAKEKTVSVAPIHFIFAQKYFDGRENRPQDTCVSSDKLRFSLFLLRWSNAIFSFFIKLCSFSVTKIKTLGTQSVPSHPTRSKKITLACYACLCFYLEARKFTIH